MNSLTGVEEIFMELFGHVPRLLFVLSGPSGVGKNTIIKKLLANHTGRVARIRTYTTREPRPGEQQGGQYHFVSREEFFRLAREGRLMEVDEASIGHDVYGSGHLYSMPADPFEGIPKEVRIVIAEVDTFGMQLLKERYKNSISIFVTAPPDDLVGRIEERVDNRMTRETLEQRMETARNQVRAARHFDYLVFNRQDHIDDTVAAIEGIIRSERMRVRTGINLEDVMPDDAFNTAMSQ